jgi:tRNA dimethylallyltransferase
MALSSNKKVIIIAGPTAVGKTAVAIQLATHFNTAIISADSRQCYKELNIGVARPSATELEQVKHYFIASHSVTDEVTAADFERYALENTMELFRHHDTVIMTGGTGLYIKAFSEGLDDIPPIDGSIRQKIIDEYNEKGIEWLQQEVREKDPEFYESGEVRNPRRLMRALEVIHGTGESVLKFRTGKKLNRDFEIIKIGLDLPKEQLHANIHSRVDHMIRSGLVEEASSLSPFRHLNALQTVGYSEIFEYLDGTISLAQAIANIKTNTRQYAKRQLTWFRRDREFVWMPAGEVVEKLIS